MCQCTSSMHKTMYLCPQQMSILYLVCDDNEVTRALDMSVSWATSSIYLLLDVLLIAKPQFNYTEGTYLHIHMRVPFKDDGTFQKTGTIWKKGHLKLYFEFSHFKSIQEFHHFSSNSTPCTPLPQYAFKSVTLLAKQTLT